MKKYKTPIMKPIELKGGHLLDGSIGNEDYRVSSTSLKWDDEIDNNENK